MRTQHVNSWWHFNLVEQLVDRVPSCRPSDVCFWYTASFQVLSGTNRQFQVLWSNMARIQASTLRIPANTLQSREMISECMNGLRPPLQGLLMSFSAAEPFVQRLLRPGSAVTPWMPGLLPRKQTVHWLWGYRIGWVEWLKNLR